MPSTQLSVSRRPQPAQPDTLADIFLQPLRHHLAPESVYHIIVNEFSFCQITCPISYLGFKHLYTKPFLAHEMLAQSSVQRYYSGIIGGFFETCSDGHEISHWPFVRRRTKPI